MINETLAHWSNLLIYSTMTVYMIAFVCYAFDLVAGSKREAAGLTAERGRNEMARERELVAAGAPSLPADADSAGAAEAAPDQKKPAPRRLGRVATAVTVIGVLLHAGGVFARGLSVERVPWGNMYEFCITASMVLVAAYLIVLLRRDLRFVGTFITGFALVMLGFAVVAFYTPAAELVPALQSYWLVIHVSVAVLASSLLALSFALSVLQLIQSYRESRKVAGKSVPLQFLNPVPGSIELENVSYRIAAVGFVLWTFTLIAGAIWAEAAWGRYWGWDTKEVWTFVIWVVYAAYLHARATRGWSSNRIAVFSIVGFLCVIFNFTIVNVYFDGLHAYSGLK